MAKADRPPADPKRVEVLEDAKKRRFDEDTQKIRNLGQIKRANLTFGDLTVLVGPQATGKSIALQLLKLMLELAKCNRRWVSMVWTGNAVFPNFLMPISGEGMRFIWQNGRTSIKLEWIIGGPETDSKT